MLTLTFLITTLFDLAVMILLLRVWMQWSRSDFYNPLSQFVVKVTQPVIGPLRRLIPAFGPVDTASVLCAYVLLVVKFTLLTSLQYLRFSFNSSLLFLSLLSLIKTAGTLILWVLIVRALMSWISQGSNPVDRLLYQLSEPLMAPVRRIVPTIGGLDFSAMIIVLVLYLLNNLGRDWLGMIWAIA